MSPDSFLTEMVNMIDCHPRLTDHLYLDAPKIKALILNFSREVSYFQKFFLQVNLLLQLTLCKDMEDCTDPNTKVIIIIFVQKDRYLKTYTTFDIFLLR